MAKVKMFKFPTFDKWVKNNYSLRTSLGPYNLHLRTIEYKNGLTRIGFAVSIDENPLNYFSEAIWEKVIDIDFMEPLALDKLEIWYNETINEFKKFWRSYIYKIYFE